MPSNASRRRGKKQGNALLVEWPVASAGEHRLTLPVTDAEARGEEAIRFRTVNVPDERKRAK